MSQILDVQWTTVAVGAEGPHPTVTFRIDQGEFVQIDGPALLAAIRAHLATQAGVNSTTAYRVEQVRTDF